MVLRVTKALALPLAIAITLVLLLLGAVKVIQHNNGLHVARAEALIHDLQHLRIGNPDSGKAAAAIVAAYGNAPPPRGFGGLYPREDCAAANHLDDCAYQLVLNSSPVFSGSGPAVVRWERNHPSVRIAGVAEWYGYAFIFIRKNVVVSYNFWLAFRTPQGEWQGVGEREGLALPKFEPVDAHISDSYSLQCLQVSNTLKASITPSASADERRHASHLDLSCLRQGSGCTGIQELMPDAWADFYNKRGHYDLGRLETGYGRCGVD